jgi:ABC-type enterochelin transport system substrate-binding protein
MMQSIAYGFMGVRILSTFKKLSCKTAEVLQHPNLLAILRYFLQLNNWGTTKGPNFEVIERYY